MLPVIAYQNPLDIWVVDNQVPQLHFLVFRTVAEQTGGGWPPVGQQQRALGQIVIVDELLERMERVPRTGGEIKHRGIGVVLKQLAVQLRHTGYGLPVVRLFEPRIIGRVQSAREVGDHDGVVNIRDQPDGLFTGGDEHFGRHSFCALGSDIYFAPTRF